MGRRALPKLDPTLDLSRHLTTVEGLPRPWDPAAFFGRDAPLEIEVGSGKGLFLVSASGIRPESNFLGCEVSRKYAAFGAGKLARAGRPYARMVHGDAQRLLHDVLPDGCAAAVHIYFPDPWWKKRHLRRRLMNTPFLTDVRRVLQADGQLHFWTDVQEYFETTVELIRALGGFDDGQAEPERPAEHDLDYQTHFERRMRLHALPVFRAVFLRVAMGEAAAIRPPGSVIS
jgi:tRNA (guanine-N7-)-methyltransferase